MYANLVHVQVSVRSRRVPGAMTDEELFAVESDRQEGEAEEDYSNLLTVEEKEQLESVLKSDNVENGDEGSHGVGRHDQGIQNGSYDYWTEEYEYGFPDDDSDPRQTPNQNGSRESPGFVKEERKGHWFGWGKKSLKREDAKKLEAVKSNEQLSDKQSKASSSGSETFRMANQSPGRPAPESQSQWKQVNRRRPVNGRRSVDSQLTSSFDNRVQVDRRASNVDGLLLAKGKGKEIKGTNLHSSSYNSHSSPRNSTHKELLKNKARQSTVRSEATSESEYKKGLRPILWLTHDFPLKTEELLPLLDILANKVKAVRRLRELLTTKLPAGSFPVKVCWMLKCNCFLWSLSFDSHEHTLTDKLYIVHSLVTKWISQLAGGYSSGPHHQSCCHIY